MKAQSTLLKRVVLAVMFVKVALFAFAGLLWGIGSHIAPGMLPNSPAAFALFIAVCSMFLVVDRRAKPTKQRAK